MSASVFILALVASGCGGSTAPAHQAQPQPASGAAPAPAPHSSVALRHVTVQLPWLVAGYDAGFYVAQHENYYKDAGLDVKLIPGRSSRLTAEIVANGKTTFGFADATSVAQIVSQGSDLKVLADLTQKAPEGIIHMPSVPVKSVKDLKGKTVFGNSSGGPIIAMLKAVLTRAGMSMNDIHLNIIQPSALASTFATHPKALVLSYSYSAYPAVLKHVPTARFTYYANLGVNTLSLGLIATNKEIQAHPKEARAWVGATLKGFQYAMDHPAKAIAIMKKEFPKEDTFILTKSLENALTLVHTPTTRGKPLGWMAASDWTSTLSILRKFGGMKAVKPLADYYTNSLLPAS